MQSLCPMKKIYLTLVAFLIPLAVWAEASKPNVVFVLFDDIGYGQPPSYRKDSPFKTPNVDKFAEYDYSNQVACSRGKGRKRSNPKGSARSLVGHPIDCTGKMVAKL